jgi:rubredoxin
MSLDDVQPVPYSHDPEDCELPWVGDTGPGAKAATKTLVGEGWVCPTCGRRWRLAMADTADKA